MFVRVRKTLLGRLATNVMWDFMDQLAILAHEILRIILCVDWEECVMMDSRELVNVFVLILTMILSCFAKE